MRMVGDQPIRLTYDREDVELMSPTSQSTNEKSPSSVNSCESSPGVSVSRSCPRDPRRWSREDLDKGLEADESFYLGDLDRIAGSRRHRSRRSTRRRTSRSRSRSRAARWTASASMVRCGFPNSGDSTEDPSSPAPTRRWILSGRARPAQAFPDVPIDEIARFADQRRSQGRECDASTSSRRGCAKSSCRRIERSRAD